MNTPTWIVMPVLAGPEMTEAAIADCLAQSVPIRLLVINQGVDDAFRERLERLAEAYSDRIFVWHHEPPLLSLAASWNRALDFVWDQGGTEALVVNNDVRLHQATIFFLSLAMKQTKAFFVSAVGVNDEAQLGFGLLLDQIATQRGGPDFSCFLISKACHDHWRFDENFIPAYCEDLDYHRRLLLAGEGARIFSVNVPYLHLAAQTLKQIDPAKAESIKRSIEQNSRAYYSRKWGGPVNQETFYTPFNSPVIVGLTVDDEDSAAHDLKRRGVGPTTPELQRWGQQGVNVPTY